jgi:alpha-amylase
MPDVCLVFVVHHAERLRHVRVFDQDQRFDSYVDERATAADLKRLATDSFLPALRLLRETAEKSDGRLRFSLAPTGPFLRVVRAHHPALLKALERLEASGRVEWIATPVDYSILSILPEFPLAPRLARQADVIESMFGRRPTTAMNTEFIFDNNIAQEARHAAMRTVLVGYADRQLHGRTANRLYAAAEGVPVRLLARHVGLSDDWGVRFSDPNWSCHPLSPATYASWVLSGVEATGGDVCPLFLHLRDLGMTHTRDSGVFTFVRQLLNTLLKHGVNFVTPADLADQAEGKQLEVLDVPQSTSGWGPNFDLSPWLGNAMQCNALQLLKTAAPAGDGEIGPGNRLLPLLAADHLRHMRYPPLAGTGAPGDTVTTAEDRRRPSPFESPYEAYLDYTNALRHVMTSGKA